MFDGFLKSLSPFKDLACIFATSLHVKPYKILSHTFHSIQKACLFLIGLKLLVRNLKNRLFFYSSQLRAPLQGVVILTPSSVSPNHVKQVVKYPFWHDQILVTFWLLEILTSSVILIQPCMFTSVIVAWWLAYHLYNIYSPSMPTMNSQLDYHKYLNFTLPLWL